MEEQYGAYQAGQHTYRVSMTLHAENREKLVKNLKQVANFAPESTAVFLEGGKAELRHDTDHEKLFRQESYFQYLFGVKEPDCYGAIETNTGKSILFVPLLPQAYAVWMGTIHPATHFAKIYSVDECYYTNEMEAVLKQKGIKTLLVLHGLNTDSKNFHSGATFEGINNFNVDKTVLFPVLSECRVHKSKQELDLLRYVTRISCDGHRAVMKASRPGTMEYEQEALFCYHTYAQAGCRHYGYTCICGSGVTSSVLHYGHAGAPNSKVVNDGDICMFDMGAEYHCYGADISRSFPANGKFSPEQKEIYLTVLASQEAVMNAMKPGVSWPAMHRLAERTILEELVKRDFLKGDIAEMEKNYVASLFMPHGLGHLLGLDTHDVGGYPGDLQRSTEPGLASLRCGRVLEENMVITVEPGVYFISAVLVPAFDNPKVNHFLNVEKIKKFLNFGGIRIEDDVIVTKDGIENMSASCPRKIEEIEALMAEGKAEKNI